MSGVALAGKTSARDNDSALKNDTSCSIYIVQKVQIVQVVLC